MEGKDLADMEELRPQGLEDLVQELEGENGVEESLPTETTVAEIDSSAEVGVTAGESLPSPAHQTVLKRYPELSERSEAAAQQTVAAQARDPQRAHADETDTGQSRLAYRLAAAVLVLGALISIMDALVAWAMGGQTDLVLFQKLPVVIDVALAVGLFQLRKGARTWVLIRAGAGATLWPILLFLNHDAITATVLSVMQWGSCGALLLLLTGQSKTWRLVLAVASFVVFTLGLFGVLMLLVLLASVL
jgi:hypothetical protein